MGHVAWAGKRGDVSVRLVVFALLIGLVPWLLSSLVVWLIMRTTGVQPWLLIVVALPFFFVLWVMITFLAGMASLVVLMLNEG